jgi:hypothetical protein
MLCDCSETKSCAGLVQNQRGAIFAQNAFSHKISVSFRVCIQFTAAAFLQFSLALMLLLLSPPPDRKESPR